MTFIPNEADAFNAIQAEFDPQDFVMVNHAISGNGVLSGCQCTEDAGGPSMDIDVAAGSINLNNDTIEVTAGSVTLDAADGTHPRIDLVVVDSGGTKTFRKGTAAATPLMPALSADDTCLCAVWIPAGDTATTDSQISDKRIFVRGFVAIRKAADEAVANSTTLQNDDHLKFHMAANEKWVYHLQLFVNNDGTSAADMRHNWSIPAGASLSRGQCTPRENGSTLNDGKFYGVYDEAGLGFGQPNMIMGAYNVYNYTGHLFGVVTNGGTPGDLQFQWAQQNSNASATNVLKGSVLLAWKIN